jgi:ribosomal protein S18 acetylase RimI-like enzyme
MGKQRLHASLILRRGELILGLIVLLMDGVHLANGHGSELCPVTGNSVAQRKVVACIDNSEDDNHDCDRSKEETFHRDAYGGCEKSPNRRSRRIKSIMPSPGQGRSAHPLTSEIEVRVLSGADAGEFSRLRLEALEREPQAFGASAEEHRAMTLEAIAKRLGSGSEGRNFVLGAFAHDQLIGTTGFYQQDGLKARHKAHVWGVYVTKEWRGKGVAHRLLSELIDRVRNRAEVEHLLLAVAVGQKPAKRVYESLGFQVYGREPRAIKLRDKYVDEDLIVLSLR